MGSFAIHALFFSVLLRSAYAVPDVRPTLTAVYGEGGLAVQGFSPKPTGIPSDPNQLFKRALPDDVCGYASANIYTPFTCYNNQFCGVRTDLGVVGCCTSYSQLTNGQYTLTGCTFRTVCYGSTDTTLCTGTCTNDARVAYCTDSNYPYCMTYTFTDVGLSYFRCNALKGVTTKVAETYTTPSSSPASATVVTTPASVVTTSVTTIITTTYSSAGSSVVSVVTSKAASVISGSGSISVGNGNPGTQAQNQAGSNTTPTGGDGGVGSSASPSALANHNQSTSTPLGAIIGGAVGGFVAVVGAIALFVFFCFKHKKNKKAEAATASGGAAYVANNAVSQNQKPTAAAGMKVPDAAVANNAYENDKMAAPPPLYQSPQMQSAHMMASPQSTNGYISPVRSEMDGRAISPTPHSTGRAELASPPMAFQSGPTSDWNRPYHELE